MAIPRVGLLEAGGDALQQLPGHGGLLVRDVVGSRGEGANILIDEVDMSGSHII